MKYDSLIVQHLGKPLGESGDERVIKCPFHQDGGKPNLYANARTGLYFCHACGAKGRVDRIDGAVRAVASLAEIQERIAACRQPKPYRVYKKPPGWLDRFDFADPYWTEVRGFSDLTIRRFRLGFDMSAGMLTIPIFGLGGDVLGVIHRRTPDDVNLGLRPKYFHPVGFKMGKTLFAANLVRRSNHTKIAITEGPLDAIACWDAGIPAVAMYGSNLSEHQAAIVRKLGVHTVVCMTDNDRAGDKAAETIKAQLHGTMVMVGLYEDGWGKDPGELTHDQRREMFEEAVHFSHAWV